MRHLNSLLPRFLQGLVLVAMAGLLVWFAMSKLEQQYAGEDEAAVMNDTLAYYMAADSGYCEMSYFSAPEHGRKTAFNETCDSLAMVCAMDFFTPIYYNDLLEISSGAVKCTVRVNDRMSIETCLKFPDRDLDLSQAAAAKMGMLTEGIRYMKWRKIVKKRT
jgi:hypothetical protein